MDSIPEHRLVTCKNAARLVHLKPATIYWYVRMKRLTKYIEKNTGIIYVDLEELANLKEAKPKVFERA